MREFLEYLFTSAGKKILMAVTGLAILGFLVVHLLGNSLLFVSPEAFNKYAYLLTSKKVFLYTAEAGLVTIFLLHIILAVKVFIENLRARPIPYKMVRSKKGASRRTIASLTMPYTGLIILAFIIYHVWTFKYGPYYNTSYDGTDMRDMFKVVFDSFKNPYIAFGYSLVMVIIGFHLYHAFSSAVQTLGINHVKVNSLAVWAGRAIAIVLGGAFTIIPLAIYFGG